MKILVVHAHDEIFFKNLSMTLFIASYGEISEGIEPLNTSTISITGKG